MGSSLSLGGGYFLVALLPVLGFFDVFISGIPLWLITFNIWPVWD